MKVRAIARELDEKEGRMSRTEGRRHVRLIGLALVASAALVLAAGATGGTSQAACDEVVLNENSWVGSTANVYVMKNVLESKLKCKVKILNITEGQPAFQAMADGKIDVVMEDWQNLGADYDPTLMAWFANFDAAWDRLRPKYGDRFYRMWKYFLLSCAGSFRARRNNVWQVVLSPRGVPGGYRGVR